MTNAQILTALTAWKMQIDQSDQMIDSKQHLLCRLIILVEKCNNLVAG